MLTRLFAILILLLPVLAAAQPITYGSPCGAPGTGYNNRTGERVTLDADGAYGLRVDITTGKWRACTSADVAKPKAPPRDCQLPRDLTWRSGDRVCAGTGVAIAHGRIGSVVSGPHRGVYVAQCSDGQVIELLTMCDERRDCEGSAELSDDGRSTVWRWSGRLAEGQRGVAAGPGGATRPVQCVAGVVGLR